MVSGVGVIFVTKFYYTEIQSFARYSPKYIGNNVCSIKFETKVMRLHKIRVEKMSMFLLNKYAFHEF